MDGVSNWKIYLLWPIKKLLLEGSTPGNEPLWFLISLYLVRIIYNYIAEWKYLDTILVLLLIMFYLLKFVDILNISEMLVYPFYLYSTFVGLLFYRAGYMLKNAQYKADVFWISVLCVIVISLLVPAQFDFRAISGDKSSKGDFVIFVIYSISACVVINNIFRYLYSKCDIKILTKIGKDSMFYYCIHWIILLFLNLYFGYFDIQLGWEQFALYIMGLVVLLPFFKKYQNKFFPVF